MTAPTARAAGNFLADVAERLLPSCDTAAIRAILNTACGGRLDARLPEGRRTSGLTSSGLPFEVSVSGGGGRYSPTVRYVTESATVLPTFADRVTAQLATLDELLALLPGTQDTTSELMHSFVAALYPDPTEVPAHRRLVTWTGLVHHADAPHHPARIKVYGSPWTVPGAFGRLRHQWPDLTALITLPTDDEFFRYAGVAIEADADGGITRKVYSTSRYRDVAVPMKLVRHFGDPAWEMLSELVGAGIDAAALHRFNFFVCSSRASGDPSLSLSLSPGRDGPELTELVRSLARRHHGGTEAVDALEQAAIAGGAQWRYSVVGLGFSAERGVDKLNVYGTPTWSNLQ